MKKSLVIKKIVFLSVALLLLNILSAYAIVPSEPHPANAIWIEPSTITLTDYNIGDKFNITAYLNMTTLEEGANGITTWQVTVYYNTTYINATRAGLTGTDGITSELFEGKYTLPVISIEPSESWVGCGETLLGADYVPVPVVASLCWIEFEVIALEPQPVQFALNISVRKGKFLEWLTFVLDDVIVDPKDPSKYNSYPPHSMQLYDGMVVPEFSSFLLMAILMSLTLAVTIFHKKNIRNFKHR
ncbi:MAG: hypothetical protein QXI91_02095 [Candidatus Bathyarchaeia archaeon]